MTSLKEEPFIDSPKSILYMLTGLNSLLPFLLGRAQQCLLQEAFLGSPLHFHRAPGFPSVTISAPDDFLYWTEKF